MFLERTKKKQRDLMIALITIFKGDGGEKLNLRAGDIAIRGPVFVISPNKLFHHCKLVKYRAIEDRKSQ